MSAANAWRAVAAEPGPPADGLVQAAAAACPGRSAAIVAIRVAQLLGAPAPEGSLDEPLDERSLDDAVRSRDGLTAAEADLLDIVELFVVDVHAISDEMMARFTAHHSPSEAMAILVHLAICDGFTKRRLLLDTAGVDHQGG